MSMIRGKRVRSPREEALHHVICAATSWRPEHFHQREDGRWFNAYGVEGTCMTLDELMKHCEREALIPKGDV